MSELKNCLLRTSLAVQWLRLHISSAEGTDSIPGQGAKDPTCHVAWPKKKKLFIKTAFQIAWKELLKAKRKESSSWESLVGDSCFPATTLMVIFEKHRTSFPVHPFSEITAFSRDTIFSNLFQDAYSASKKAARPHFLKCLCSSWRQHSDFPARLPELAALIPHFRADKRSPWP